MSSLKFVFPQFPSSSLINNNHNHNNNNNNNNNNINNSNNINNNNNNNNKYNKNILIATPPLVSPRDDVWGPSAKIPYWWTHRGSDTSSAWNLCGGVTKCRQFSRGYLQWEWTSRIALRKIYLDLRGGCLLVQRYHRRKMWQVWHKTGVHCLWAEAAKRLHLKKEEERANITSIC